MRARAVIFDFDGVILETGDIKTQAFADLFEDAPEHQDAIVAYHLDNLGVSRYRKFEWIYRELLRRPLSESESRALGERFSSLVFERVLAAPFVPGAEDCLATLRGQTPMYVASGTPQEELDRVVDERGLRPYFDEVHGSPRGKIEILEEILERHGYTPDEVVFVGDGESDYKAAVGTRVPFVARLTPALRDRWIELEACGVEDLRDLLELVEGAVT